MAGVSRLPKESKSSVVNRMLSDIVNLGIKKRKKKGSIGTPKESMTFRYNGEKESKTSANFEHYSKDSMQESIHIG